MQAISKRPSPPALALSIASYSIPFRMPGSQQDRQVLHYFCVQGSHDIAGYLSSSFWSHTVLQASHQDPVILQALVSLSSLHLAYATSGLVVMSKDILNRYGKALRALGRRVEAGTTDAIKAALICCILFYCFECTLGNSEAALQHLRGGINILCNSQHQFHSHGKDQDMSVVSAVFQRLRVQAAIFDTSSMPDLAPQLDKEWQVLKELPPETSSFERIEDAHHALVNLQGWLFQFLNANLAFKDDEAYAIPTDVQNEKELLVRNFAMWEQRFEPLNQISARDSVTVCASKLLLMHWQITSMLLSSDYPHDETVFGACSNTGAERVLRLATDVLQATKERNTSAAAARSPHHNFSSETGVVAPLFILAMKCSDESICEKATNLLTASQRREGLYDSNTMATITRSFRAAQLQKILGDGTSPGTSTHESLEKTFAEEIDRVTGGMDRIADFISPTPSKSLS
ncbi:hypothetical protein Q7P37_008239 [Cladosporium fusiforme]